MSDNSLPNDSPSSNAQLARAVETRMRTCHYWHLRSITCESKQGVVTILGRVPSYYLRDLAERLVSQVDGVEEIVNLIQVAGPDTWHHVEAPNSSD